MPKLKPPHQKKLHNYTPHLNNYDRQMEEQRNKKRKIKIGINDKQNSFHSGTCKYAYEPVLNPDYPIFSVFEHEFKGDKFVILRYADKDSCSFSNIYKELEYYNIFGKAGFSPVVSQILTVLSVSVLLKAKLSKITNDEYATQMLASLQDDDDDDITIAYQQFEAIQQEIRNRFMNNDSAETFNEYLQEYKKTLPAQLKQDYRQNLHFTPDEFLSYFSDENVGKPDSSADVWVLMEKANCGNTILKLYEDNYRQMFIDLRIFLKRFVESFRLINADIKLDNLCTKDGQFIMIDFDPDYIFDIVGSNIELRYFIDYMLFQTYTNIIIWHGRNDRINIPIIFSEDYIREMETQIRKFGKKDLINELYSHSKNHMFDTNQSTTMEKLYQKLRDHGASSFEPIEFEPPRPNNSSWASIFGFWGSGKKTKRKKRSKKNRSRRF